jgi:hypothetical protein
VASLEHGSEVWKTMTEMFTSQLKSLILQLCSQLSIEKWKGVGLASTYYTKMKGIADEMVAAGRKIEDAGLFGYILNRFDEDYNSFVSSITIKDNLTLCDLYT